MYMDMSQDPFHARICGENSGDQDRDAKSVRACAMEMHMDMSQMTGAILCQKTSDRYPRFARACAVEMHMDI